MGGTEVYVAALCRDLAAAGHDVAVAVPSPGARAHTEAEVDGVRVMRYATPSAPTRAQSLEREATPGSEMLLQWVARERPDVVHFHTLTTGLGVREVAAVKDLGIATVFTAHSASLGYICQRGTLLEFGMHACSGVRTTRECTACMLQMHGAPRPLAATLARLPAMRVTDTATRPAALMQAGGVIALNRDRQTRLFGALDASVALTDWAAAALLANGADPSRVHVNRLGVRLPPDVLHGARGARGTRGGPLRVGYLGRFDPIKGIHVLARAAADIPPHVQVEIVFRGPASTAEEQQVGRELRGILGGDPRFTIGDGVPLDATYDFLAGIDVLCCPSLCAEGGPTVALEARAVGTPVIGSDIGGVREIVQDGVDGALFAPGDALALAALLTSLASDRGRLDDWRARIGRVRTMHDVARDYVSLYESICKHASAL